MIEQNPSTDSTEIEDSFLPDTTSLEAQKRFLKHTREMKFSPLFKLKEELGIEFFEVLEALLRANLEGTKIQTYTRVVNKVLEVDSWADAEQRVRRVDHEYFHAVRLDVSGALSNASEKAFEKNRQLEKSQEGKTDDKNAAGKSTVEALKESIGTEAVNKIIREAEIKAQKNRAHILSEAKEEPFTGFIEIPFTALEDILHSGSSKIQTVWEDDENYITFQNPVEINKHNIYVNADDTPLLFEKITASTSSLFSVELLELIRSKYHSNPEELIHALESQEQEIAKLNDEIYWLKDCDQDKKGDTKDLLIAGLLALIIDKCRADDGKKYIKSTGKLETGIIQSEVIKRLKLDKELSGTSGFKNLIPNLYRKHAKK
ncbi:hypothetical protein ACMXYO_01125 [Neptuniibacter sp. QD37_6]|uniref:hypothetical protein n=1 Tax=Neptuniibacter sp. QD37_6 TaxID=3398210 RepID=UPI0039F586AE